MKSKYLRDWNGLSVIDSTKYNIEKSLALGKHEMENYFPQMENYFSLK